MLMFGTTQFVFQSTVPSVHAQAIHPSQPLRFSIGLDIGGLPPRMAVCAMLDVESFSHHHSTFDDILRQLVIPLEM